MRGFSDAISGTCKRGMSANSKRARNYPEQKGNMLIEVVESFAGKDRKVLPGEDDLPIEQDRHWDVLRAWSGGRGGDNRMVVVIIGGEGYSGPEREERW